jgi:hypothetical protein
MRLCVVAVPVSGEAAQMPADVPGEAAEIPADVPGEGGGVG